MFVKRSYSTFKFGAFFVGTAFIVLSIAGIITGFVEGMDLTLCLISILFFVLGVGLMAGGFYITKVLGNDNAGKIDTSIEVKYDMTCKGETGALETMEALTEAMRNLVPGEEIMVRLTPEYFGLTDWKFIKIKYQYVSFVHVTKKEKTTEYFLMPQASVEDALAPFKEVFEERKAINTANLMSMNRYQAVLEYYKLK